MRCRRNWDSPPDEEYDVAAEGEDPDGLVSLIEKMPALVELYLAVSYPDMDPLMKIKFPSSVRKIRFNVIGPINLSVLANNRTLKNAESVAYIRNRKAPREAESFHKQFGEFVDSPNLKQISELAIEAPELDDKCCSVIAGSRVVKQLKRLRLAGNAITDAGAATLAESPAIRQLEDLVVASTSITPEGIEKMRAAGIPMHRCVGSPTSNEGDPQW